MMALLFDKHLIYMFIELFDHLSFDTTWNLYVHKE